MSQLQKQWMWVWCNSQYVHQSLISKMDLLLKTRSHTVEREHGDHDDLITQAAISWQSSCVLVYIVKQAIRGHFTASSALKRSTRCSLMMFTKRTSLLLNSGMLSLTANNTKMINKNIFIFHFCPQQTFFLSLINIKMVSPHSEADFLNML